MSTTAQEQLQQIDGGLVVSCQAPASSPLHGPVYMAAMAAAAMQGGAVGIRADGVADIEAIQSRIGAGVPVIGILKTRMPDGSAFITATSEHARQVVAAGARLVALDGTPRTRPGGESLSTVIDAIHAFGGVALADIDSVESALHAIACGAEAVGTTMSGYTPESTPVVGPDFALLADLTSRVSVPVFAEGRIWTREEAVQAFSLGASFVVVGTAITNPLAITERFVSAIRQQ